MFSFYSLDFLIVSNLAFWLEQTLILPIKLELVFETIKNTPWHIYVFQLFTSQASDETNLYLSVLMVFDILSNSFDIYGWRTCKV